MTSQVWTSDGSAFRSPPTFNRGRAACPTFPRYRDRGVAATPSEQQQPHAAASPGPVGQGEGGGGAGRTDEDGAGPRVKTVSWPGCRAGGECLYGERGMCGRWEPRGVMGDAFVSWCVSKVGSEATVCSAFHVRDDIGYLVPCKCDSVCDERPLKV